MTATRRLLVCVVVAAGLAGCGSAAATTGSSTTSTTTSTTTTSSSTTTTMPTTTTTTVRPARPLTGVVVGLDPGHNGGNWRDPAFIDRTVSNGISTEPCDTTGTATDAGYTEARFNWNVAIDVRRDLAVLGAHVVLTRPSNNGVGPCITTRALLLDRANVDVAFDIHADGGPPGGRGFAILVPVRDRWNHRVVHESLRLAHVLRATFRAITKMPWSTYDGVDAIQPRNDLAGLNLTTVPKVLIECGNMRNPTDAALLASPAFQRLAARAITDSVLVFLGRRVTA
ncbi:MAG TPA: N-acetylmuramoyl-L-alanine amidase [Acidimicrobiales bacterium]|nr:N-acetylmuramoyl-L-alanine amidase [Acidimicrobiales bacterium]